MLFRSPFADDSFDAVFAYHTISHTDAYLAEQIIREISRILRPGAEAFLTLCSKSSPNFSEPSYPRIDAGTVLKTKDGPEYGVAHFYVDLEDILTLFSEFELIHISEVTDLWYDGERHDSRHFHLLIQKSVQANG